MLERNQKKNYIRWTILGCGLICFGLIASQVVQNPVISFDETIRYWVYEQRSPLLSAIFIPVTYMGNWQTITVLAAVLLAIPKTRRDIGLPFAVISLSSTVV